MSCLSGNSSTIKPAPVDNQVVFIPSDDNSVFVDPNGNALTNFDWWVESITFADDTTTTVGQSDPDAKPSWVSSVDFQTSNDAQGQTIGNPQFTIDLTSVPADYRSVFIKVSAEFAVQGVQEGGFCFNLLAGTFAVVLHYNVDGNMCAVRPDGSRWRSITSTPGALDTSQGAVYDEVARKIYASNLDPDGLYEIDMAALEEALGVPTSGLETEVFSFGLVDPYGLTINTEVDPREIYVVYFSTGAINKITLGTTPTNTELYPAGTVTNPIDVVYYQSNLYITQQESDIVRLASDGSSVSPTVILEEDNLLAVGITSFVPRKITVAKDFTDGVDKLWFVNSHFNNKAILKVLPDGTGLTVVANGLTIIPLTLAVDGNKVFWSGSAGTTINALDHDGANPAVYNHTGNGAATELIGLTEDPWDDSAYEYQVILWGAYNSPSGIKAGLNYDGPSNVDLINIVSSDRIAPCYNEAAGLVYYASRTGDTIYSAPLVEGASEAVLFSDGSGPYTMDGLEDLVYNPVDGRIYWTEPDNGLVRYAAVDGSVNPTTLYTAGEPRGLTVNGTTLYWTDGATGEVVQGDTSGSSATALMSVFSLPDLPLSWIPRGIDIDSVNNCLFIADATPSGAKIYKYDLVSTVVTLVGAAQTDTIYYSLVCDEDQQHLWLSQFTGGRLVKFDIPSKSVDIQVIDESIGDNNLGICLVRNDPFGW